MGSEASQQQEEDLSLLKPFQLGPFKLAHRIVMAPLTRCRYYGHVPQPHAALYYSQRATPGGFLIAEATSVNATGDGYPETPGIWTPEQVEAWKPIVKAVKDKGAYFFCQIWPVGRVSHTSYQPSGAKPVSCTNQGIRSGSLFALDGSGLQPYSEPRALRTDEIPGFVQDFAQAAKNAVAAGFDGIELHGSHGYLLDQFMKSSSNDRTDKYGETVENRCRFVLEVVDAVVEAIGAHRVGIRLSPFASVWEASDSDPLTLGLHLMQELSKRKILYVHYVPIYIHPEWDPPPPERSEHGLGDLRKAFKAEGGGGGGAFFRGGGFTRETGNATVESGEADAIVYGRPFVANPDLVKRFKLDAPLNAPNRATFYSQDPVEGYTDYPFLEQSHPEAEKSNPKSS